MTSKEALDILVGSLNHHTRGVFSSGEQEAIDILKNSVSDQPKFILIGGYSINLKEIRQYSLKVTKAYGQLPDGTPKMAESWGLAIWLYGNNCPRSIGYGTKEEAEKLKEKLDNIFGVIDLGKEN